MPASACIALPHVALQVAAGLAFDVALALAAMRWPDWRIAVSGR